MNNNLEKCFEKHPFNELQYIDYYDLIKGINFTKNKFKSGTFFDVGSNCGSFVNALKNFNFTSDIHCFEPHPILASKTKENHPNIIMNNYCLGNFTGIIDIYIPTWSVGLSSIIKRPVFDQLNQDITVLKTNITTIDDYCKGKNISIIDYLKIDVEGYEFDVLKGATELLKENKIIAGQFEIGQTLVDANVDVNDICKFLESFNYTIHKDIIPCNFIFSI
jgi:FkbM family methyltransferase